ncbi:MAG: hypothetical protein KKH67_03800 [candidate division Zixibacteria bacterium]|nr:hypothetical protein [candidate division Zixibacteria bacterium]MBU1469751.1 hypothetical protein [candidate division Zixibacteria bacterium]
MTNQKLTVEQAEVQLKELAKRWLAMDGLWFQAVERKYGMEAAIELDKQAWAHFSPIEANRIMNFLGIEPGGGLDALEKCLQYRCYSFINTQEITRPAPDKCVLKMTACRVQDARHRKGMNPFPCKEVGVIEYETFAKTIDPRIEVNCIACPPDEQKRDFWCAWEFTLNKHHPA